MQLSGSSCVEEVRSLAARAGQRPPAASRRGGPAVRFAKRNNGATVPAGHVLARLRGGASSCVALNGATAKLFPPKAGTA